MEFTAKHNELRTNISNGIGRKEAGRKFRQLYKQKEEQQMELIEWILDEKNIQAAIKAVKQN